MGLLCHDKSILMRTNNFCDLIIDCIFRYFILCLFFCILCPLVYFKWAATKSPLKDNKDLWNQTDFNKPSLEP